MSNEAVRVDAKLVRAKVIGEGGNLGATQAARIEFALRGGRINTDFVDNSGGVEEGVADDTHRQALPAAREDKLITATNERDDLDLPADLRIEAVLNDPSLEEVKLTTCKEGMESSSSASLRMSSFTSSREGSLRTACTPRCTQSIPVPSPR